MRGRFAALRRCLVALIPILALLLCGGWLWQAVIDAREAPNSSACHANIYILRHALYNYHDAEGALPPAYVADPNGKPLSSWRVLLAPYCTKHVFFESYNLEAPWDNKANLELAQNRGFAYLFACPSGPRFNVPSDAGFDAERPRFTNYVAIVGPGTAFPGGNKTVSLRDITDGVENTILLVEIANSDIHWSEPRDLQFDQMSFTINHPTKPSISSPHSKGPGVMFADGRFFRIAESMPPTTLKALVTINGEEDISRDQLVSQGLLK